MAAARAAARRQAILGSRGNRLAKLTSSARGGDPGGVYTNDDSPLPAIGGTGLEKFVGEETDLPKPPTTSPPVPKPQPRANAPTARTPQRDSEQQQEFINALMGGLPGQPGVGEQPPFNISPKEGSAAPAAPQDLISSMLASLGGGEGAPFPAEALPPPTPRTFTQKLIPVLHTLSMLAILAWFIGWKEPETFAAAWRSYPDKTGGNGPETIGGIGKDEWWMRWARLARTPSAGGVNVPPLPAFFWAFITSQLVLHSLQIVSQPAYRPPMLLGLVIPHLPSQLSEVILTSLKYFQMGSMILDDLAILVFGIGLVVFVSSNWMT